MEFIRHTKNSFSYITAPNIKATHAFTLRYGEPNDGKFSEGNISMLCRLLGLMRENVVCSKQVHGDYVHVIAHSTLHTPHSTLNEADALVTNTPGIALMVFTADCVPILLHDSKTGSVGAVHAGWRGTALNIAATAVYKMESEFGCSPADIHAAIGPSISKCCFETDSDVFDAMCGALGEIQAAEICRAADTGKYMIDLKEANRIMLINAGVRDVAVSDDCTACSGDLYWSHRKHGKKRGSQAAIIVSS